MSETSSLFEIELDHVIVDELHLLLRITNKLIGNQILRMAELDNSKRVHAGNIRTHIDAVLNHMDQLVQAIWCCGIHSQVR